MKFCAVVCELNPLHNGHLRLFREAKEKSGCDALLLLMSGNFTQRGDMAVFSKYTRAKQAVECGADVVLELPALFSVSPAELFAGGAIHVLSSLPSVNTLAFGCEKEGDFLAAAKLASREMKQFRSALKEAMKDGTSYVRARTQVVLALNPSLDPAFLSSPNNILGLEYCRAILSEGAAIEPLPILREGAGHNDLGVKKNFSASSAIRPLLYRDDRRTRKLLKGNVPPPVLRDEPARGQDAFEKACLLFLTMGGYSIVGCPDCAEGLENRLRSLALTSPSYDEVTEKGVSKRYTRSRIKRTLTQNLLGVTRRGVEDALASPLYLRTLAVKKDRAEEILSALSKGSFPLVTRKCEALELKKEALTCFEKDYAVNETYNILNGIRNGGYETIFV